jgi:hypothetical protein
VNASRRPASACPPSYSRYSVYLLYSYNSTNTDTGGAACQAILELADKDGSGSIEFNEFKGLFAQLEAPPTLVQLARILKKMAGEQEEPPVKVEDTLPTKQVLSLSLSRSLARSLALSLSAGCLGVARQEAGALLRPSRLVP